MSVCVDMHKSLPRPRISEDPMVDPKSRSGGCRGRAIPSTRSGRGLASPVHWLSVRSAERMTVGRKQRIPSPSDELQATSDRLSARTEALQRGVDERATKSSAPPPPLPEDEDEEVDSDRV